MNESTRRAPVIRAIIFISRLTCDYIIKSLNRRLARPAREQLAPGTIQHFLVARNA